MIYHIYFILMIAGNSAIGFLLGAYMMRYGAVDDSHLGYLFMIAPMSIFLRPLICAQADRHQSHKRLLTCYLFLTGFAYLPFILIPFLSGTNDDDDDHHTILTPRLRFWILAGFHLAGSIGLCGVRALGDALTVNYAKLTGTSYGRYRKYGSISLGVCSYLLGFVNQNSWLPDFVPAFIVWCGCYFLLTALVYGWPKEYFQMKNSGLRHHHHQHVREEKVNWPSGREIIQHLTNKWLQVVSSICSRCCYSPSSSSSSSFDLNHTATTAKDKSKTSLSVGQQLSIFSLLIRRDFRVVLYSLAIIYAGLVGYSGPNFVFTHLNEVCHQQQPDGAQRCDSAQLAGSMIVLISIIDTLCYIWLDFREARQRRPMNRLLMLEITFVSLTCHYCFFGLLLPNLSPSFFLVESLHGIEYSLSLTLCVELGYLFASEVELLLPELISSKIINQSEEDEPKDNNNNNNSSSNNNNNNNSNKSEVELVKVSLMATMSAYYTLLYEGFGCILGSFIFGQTISYYSFTFTWILIGILAFIGLLVLICAHLISNCVDIQPELLRMQTRPTTKQVV